MTTKLIKPTLLAVSLAAAFAASAPASAVTGILFDRTGSGGGGTPLDRFNWVSTQALAQATFPSVAPGTADGSLYGQGRLGGAQLGSSILGDGGLLFPRFTYQFQAPVTAQTSAGDAIGSVASFTDRAPHVLTPADNYFRIFYDPTPTINEALGTGYGNSEGEVGSAGQILIFEGRVQINPNAGSNFAITNTTFSPIGTSGTTTQGGIPIVTVGGSGSLNLNVEHCDADDILDAANTLCFGGVVTTIDTNFFRSDIEGLTIDLNLGNGIQTPFTQQPVPRQVVNQTPSFGGVVAGTLRNNYLCEGAASCDMLYQGQNAVTNFFGTFVPEPSSVALLGLGLAALGGFRRKAPKA